MMSRRGLVLGIPLGALLWLVIIAAAGSVGAADHPPSLPALEPRPAAAVGGCVASALACFADELLGQNPAATPMGVQAITDGVPYPLIAQQQIDIGTDCWLFQSFGGDGVAYATYVAPCGDPNAVTRVR